MSDKIKLDIITPNNRIFSLKLDMVIVPSVEGDIGVLPHHSSMIVALRSGAVVLYSNNKVVETIVVNTGFAEISSDTCTLLIESGMVSEDISESTVKSAKEKALASGIEKDMSYFEALEQELHSPVYR